MICLALFVLSMNSTGGLFWHIASWGCSLDQREESDCISRCSKWISMSYILLLLHLQHWLHLLFIRSVGSVGRNTWVTLLFLHSVIGLEWRRLYPLLLYEMNRLMNGSQTSRWVKSNASRRTVLPLIFKTVITVSSHVCSFFLTAGASFYWTIHWDKQRQKR